MSNLLNELPMLLPTVLIVIAGLVGFFVGHKQGKETGHHNADLQASKTIKHLFYEKGILQQKLRVLEANQSFVRLTANKDKEATESPNYYHAHYRGKDALFTPHEWAQGRKRADKQPEDTKV